MYTAFKYGGGKGLSPGDIVVIALFISNGITMFLKLTEIEINAWMLAITVGIAMWLLLPSCKVGKRFASEFGFVSASTYPLLYGITFFMQDCSWRFFGLSGFFGINAIFLYRCSMTDYFHDVNLRARAALFITLIAQKMVAARLTLGACRPNTKQNFTEAQATVIARFAICVAIGYVGCRKQDQHSDAEDDDAIGAGDDDFF